MDTQAAIFAFTALFISGMIWVRTRMHYRGGAGPLRLQTIGRIYFVAAIALLIAGDSPGAVAELRNARPLRRMEDCFQAPLYDELRAIAPDGVDELLRQWPR